MDKKFFVLLLIFGFTFGLQTDSKSSQFISTRFKSVFCNSVAEIITVKFCFVRAYSRTLATLNLGFYYPKALVKPVDVDIQTSQQLLFQVTFSFLYKYGTIYRQVLKTKAEWCEIMDQRDKNPLIGMVVDLLYPSVPQLFHECPYGVTSIVLRVQIDCRIEISSRVSFDSTI
jgi:hypothetical protein